MKRLIIQEVGLSNSTIQLVANLTFSFFAGSSKAALLIDLGRIQPPPAF